MNQGNVHTVGYMKTIDNPSSVSYTSIQSAQDNQDKPGPHPFTFTWDGINYKPDFIPELIKMVGYRETDYLAVKDAYNDAISKLRTVEAKYRVRDILATAAEENIDFWREKYLAIRKLHAVRAYLKAVDSDNYDAQRIVHEAIMDYDHEQVDVYRVQRYRDYKDPHKEERSI